jgi:hypothetical protein
VGPYHAGLAAVHTQAGKEGKQFFFEKKNQKTFVILASSPASARTPIYKSFCFFFQKEALPSLASVTWLAGGGTYPTGLSTRRIWYSSSRLQR